MLYCPLPIMLEKMSNQKQNDMMEKINICQSCAINHMNHKMNGLNVFNINSKEITP